MERSVAAIPLLVRQHAQDAAFLWVQRAREIDGPLFAEADVGRRDQRLDANIEGLAAAGRIGRDIAKEEALGVGGPGEWFTLAALALETEDAHAMNEAAGLALEAGTAGERGLSGATAWTPPGKLASFVRRWLVAAEPRLRQLGAAALGHHRVDPGARLPALLADPDPGVRARGARLAGEVGRMDTLPLLRELIEDRQEAWLWPAWAAARLGDPAGAGTLLAVVGERPGDPQAGQALDMAVVAVGERARPAVTALLGRPETHLLALSRLGVLGDRSILPWLVDRMREPATAEAAGSAFRDLFPVNVNGTDLFTEYPETLGPAFADLDPAPLPVADRIAVWPGPSSEAVPFVSQRARMLAALRAGAAEPGRPLPTWRHRHHYPAWV